MWQDEGREGEEAKGTCQLSKKGFWMIPHGVTFIYTLMARTPPHVVQVTIYSCKRAWETVFLLTIYPAKNAYYERKKDNQKSLHSHIAQEIMVVG